MRNMNSDGKYNRKVDGKPTGEVVEYPYVYRIFEKLDDIPASEMLELANRQEKVDCNNTARAKAQIANGDAVAVKLTPEQKEANKQARKVNAEIVAIAKAKGLSPADLLALLG